MKWLVFSLIYQLTIRVEFSLDFKLIAAEHRRLKALNFLIALAG